MSPIIFHVITLVTFLFGLISAEESSFATKQNTSTVEEIVNTCYQFLESHLCEGKKWGKNYHFYRPALEKYSADQWLWDSGSHMIVWSHKNVTNSILDLRSMLHFQQPNGMIPEEIFWSDRSLKDEVAIRLEYSNIQFTDITQMPVLPFSLRAMYNQTHDKKILREFLQPLVDYFKWWRNYRDLGDGLVFIIHNWESGLDASPAYDPAFGVYVTELNQSSFYQLYPKFLEVIETYNLLYKWNMTEIYARETAKNENQKYVSWWKVKDLAVNCVYAAGWKILSELATILNETNVSEDCLKEYEISSNAIITKMFIKEQNHYNSLYIDAHGQEQSSIANSVQNLFPLLLDNLPEDHLSIILSHLLDEKKFNAKFMIPTVSQDDPQFSATFEVDLMWRGPVWGFTNWFIMEGLGKHNRYDIQKQVLDKWISLVQQSGIYEHYNPLTGEPYGPEGLGMSTLICDWIYRYDMI
jgi:hypothetical protein